MSFYDQAVTENKRERVALVVGSYGKGDSPGLKIVSYIGAKPTKTEGLVRHSFLVAPIEGADFKVDGGEVGTAGRDGAAFWTINLDDHWLETPSIALAFNLEEKGIEDGLFDVGVLEATRSYFMDLARRKCEEANTPDDQLDDATEAAFKKIIQQININVGSIFRLQDWGGQPRNPQAALDSLVGVEFAGRIGEGNNGNTEVSSIYPHKKKK